MPAPSLPSRWNPIVRWLLQFPLSRAHWAVLVATLTALAMAEIYVGQHIIVQTNFEMRTADQSAYMGLATSSRRDVLPQRTDGIRNPLFVWLVSRYAHLEREQFFLAGKQFNVRLATAATVLLGLSFGCFFSLLPALTLSLLAGVAVLLPIATYFGAEPLFYFFFFGYWLCALMSLWRNPVWLYGLAGAFAGTAYLAKASVTLLTGMWVLACAWRWWENRRLGSAEDLAWSSRRLVLGALLFLAIYGVMVSPRALYAQRAFGAPFYSVTSQRFWATNFNEIFPIVGKLNPKRIHEIPPDQRPSMQRYFRTHTMGDFFNRLCTGTRNQVALLWSGSLDWNAKPEKWENGRPRRGIARLILLRGAYLLGFALIAVALAASAGGWRALDPGARAATLLVAGTFVVHLLAFGWYTHYTSLSRFILGLYIPLAFACIWGAETLRRRYSQPWIARVYATSYLAVVVLLISRVVTLVRFPIFDGLKGAF